MTQEERERQSNKEALKAVWKYYMMAFAGIGLIFVARYLTGTIGTVLNVVGAVLFFAGVFIVLYWDRKAKQKAMDEIQPRPRRKTSRKNARAKNAESNISINYYSLQYLD